MFTVEYYRGKKIKNKKRQSIFNRFTSVYEQSREVVGQLCVATDLLIGQKMTGAKGNNSLQPVDSAAGNQIRKRSRVHKEQGDWLPLACENE